MLAFLQIGQGQMTDGPLRGLKVVDVSSNLASAFTTTLFADFGAEVVMIERPGGSKLRDQAGWPFWARGKKSIVLDLTKPEDGAIARSLLIQADVVVDAFGPSVADRLGLGYETLAEENQSLVYTSITGFGRTGPYANLKGYEAIVQAKLGMPGAAPPSGRQGPSIYNHPSATFGAALLAMQGTLVALFERETSGRGQRVDATLVQGIAGQDPFAWAMRFVAKRYPGAFVEAGSDDTRGVPTNRVSLGVMMALSHDGRWMQFAHSQEKQFDGL